MKKLKTFNAICIITCLFLSSCGINMSITKRHYSDGYYIDYSKAKQEATDPKEEKKVVKNKIEEPLYPILEQVDQNTTVGYSDQNSLKQNNVSAASDEKIPESTSSFQSLMQTVKQKTGIIESHPKQITHILFKTKKTIRNSSDDDGLSLFWIIILVLLILWALGFLAGGFGLGGLINLLLLIALILLILWLLRIV